VQQLLSVDPALWRKELTEIRDYLGKFGARVPAALLEELRSMQQRLG
jgi:GTP-dependent phosphoenolpyruvate carboxykinase